MSVKKEEVNSTSASLKAKKSITELKKTAVNTVRRVFHAQCNLCYSEDKQPGYE